MMAYCSVNAADEDDGDEDEDDESSEEGAVVEAETQEIIRALRHVVARDPLAAELHLSLFASAVFSRRCASVAQPLPAEYDRPGGLQRLAAALEAAPALRLLVDGSPAAAQAAPTALHLLRWLLTPAPLPPPQAVPAAPAGATPAHWPSALLRALPRPPPAKDAPAPNHLFEVINPKIHEKWREMARGKKIVSGFIGQPLDSFFSMVHCGLRPGGENIKIRRSLKSALNDSTAGHGLGSSELGAPLLCVAECECVVEMPGLAVAAAGDDLHLVLLDGRLARLTRLHVFKSDAEQAAASPAPAPAVKAGAGSASGSGSAAGASQRRASAWAPTRSPIRLPEFKFEVEIPSKSGQQQATSSPQPPARSGARALPAAAAAPSRRALPVCHPAPASPPAPTSALAPSPFVPGRPADAVATACKPCHAKRKSLTETFIAEEFSGTPSGELEEIRPHVQRYIQDFECNIRDFSPRPDRDFPRQFKDLRATEECRGARREAAGSLMDVFIAREHPGPSLEEIEEIESEMQEFDPESEPTQELFTTLFEGLKSNQTLTQRSSVSESESSSEMKRKEALSATREALMDSPHASQRFRISMDQIKPESEEPYDVTYTRRLLKSSIREFESTRRDLPELLMEKLSARFPESASDSEEDIHTEMSSLLTNPSSEGSYDGPTCGVLPPNEGLLQGQRGFDARMFPDVTDKLRMWPASSWAWKQREESTVASPQHERSTNTGEDSLFNYLLSQMKTLVNKVCIGMQNIYNKINNS